MLFLDGLFGENKKTPEFEEALKHVFKESRVFKDRETGANVTIVYDLNSEFFVNSDKTIAYMVGKVENLEGSTRNKKVAEEFENCPYLEKDLVQKEKIIVFSEMYDHDKIFTGNFKFESLDTKMTDLSGMYDEKRIGDIFLRSRRDEKDFKRVVENHKNYISDFELISNPDIVHDLVEMYPFIDKISISDLGKPGSLLRER